MKMRSLMTIAALLLATATASASALDLCSYEEMLAFAIKNSLTTEVYGEKIVHSGGSSAGSEWEVLLVADLVSTTGYREIQLVRCDPEGDLTTITKSVRLGKVVFSPKNK